MPTTIFSHATAYIGAHNFFFIVMAYISTHNFVLIPLTTYILNLDPFHIHLRAWIYYPPWISYIEKKIYVHILYDYISLFWYPEIRISFWISKNLISKRFQKWYLVRISRFVGYPPNTSIHKVFFCNLNNDKWTLDQ